MVQMPLPLLLYRPDLEWLLTGNLVGVPLLAAVVLFNE